MPHSVLTLDKGSKVWYLQDASNWQLADILHKNGQNTINIQLKDGKTVNNVGIQHLEPANPPVQDSIPDVTQLSYLNEPGILHNLLQRFQKGVIYTTAGPVLIAVNPCKGLPLYTAAVADQYKAASLLSSKSLEPHIFGVVGAAFRDLVRTDVSQSIIINGESGAGKTETAKKAMQFLATLAGGTGVDQQVLETNPILEAFGNAKTQRNPNSSRFGKLIEIHFNNRHQICGAVIKTYLLEKSRVVHQLPGERSFHIFYQLVRGVTDKTLRQQLRLPEDVAAFNYLNRGGCSDIPGVDDAGKFSEVLQALSDLGLHQNTDIKPILAALSGTLWLGNLQIEAVAGSDSSRVVADEALTHAAALLEVKEDDLAYAITHKKITAGAETIIKQLTAANAADARDALAKALYAGVFDRIVQATNAKLDTGRLSSGKFIAILDIYGFEHFKTNSFEQLCINYANERLQQQFTQHLFTQEQDLFEQEGIDWSKIEWVDNQASLDVIETNPRTGPGVLSVLNTLCKIASSTDQKFLTEMKNMLSGSSHLMFNPLKKDEFVIRHYAADVGYSVTGFLDKNRDTLNQDLVDLMQYSSSNIVSSIGSSAAAPPPELARLSARTNHQPRPSSQTVSSRFATHLQDLISMLDTTGLHFVRCIKPNFNLEPGTFSTDMVLQQLRCCGVLEVARVAQAGYPTRYKYRDFIERYLVMLPVEQQMLLLSAGGGGDETVMREAARKVLDEFEVPESDYKLGDTIVFFKTETGLLGQLEDSWAKMQSSATTIQATWRMHIARKQYLEIRAAATAVQACRRGQLARRKIDRQQRAAVVIQRFYKSCMARRKILHAIKLVREAHRAGQIDRTLSVHIESQVATAGAIDDLMIQYGITDLSEVRSALECYAVLRRDKLGRTGVVGLQRALQLLEVVRAAGAAEDDVTPEQLNQQLQIAAMCREYLGDDVDDQQLQDLIAAAEEGKAFKATSASTTAKQVLLSRQSALASGRRPLRDDLAPAGPSPVVDDEVVKAASLLLGRQSSILQAQSSVQEKPGRSKGSLLSRAKNKVGRLTGQSSSSAKLAAAAAQQQVTAVQPAPQQPQLAVLQDADKLRQVIAVGTSAFEQGISDAAALKAALAAQADLRRQLEAERAARVRFAKQQEQLALEWNTQVKILESYITSLQAEVAGKNTEE